MTWRIVVVEPARSWLHDLRKSDRRTTQVIGRALEALADRGPGLGRPMVDSITGSRLANLKELRPGSAGFSKIRLLFAFDARRQAVILVGGDKAGRWRRWYRDAIPEAEAAYAAHLQRMQDEEGEH